MRWLTRTVIIWMAIGGALVALWGGKAQENVRQPAVAGAFYPGDAVTLVSTVDQLLAEAPAPAVTGELVALIAPHAGYAYSGSVAATAFRLLQGQRVDTIILVGVAHRAPVEGAALSPHAEWAMPLGRVRVRREAVDWLAQQPHIVVSETAHAEEHSLEVELPFLQRILPQAEIVPLVMGSPDLATCLSLGQTLAQLVERERQAGRRCVLLASSDLSHYPSVDDAHAIDRRTLAAVATGDPERLHAVSVEIMAGEYQHLYCTWCGEGAVKTVMAAARALGATQVSELRYATSADASPHERDRVVGYAAVVFARGGAATSPRDDRAQLLQLARQALSAHLADHRMPSSTIDPSWPAAWREPAAVFVTLRRDHQLRGCVGTTEATRPLGLAVQHYAIASATEDDRFAPVSADELPSLSMEISVLSPMQRVADAAQIQRGRHGVLVRRAGRAGLLLPQVWEETGWGLEQFLNALCAQKAGLPADAWRDAATELYVFTVETFSE